MWPSDAELLDPRESHRRREAYARALDHQIALRRSYHQQQQQAIDELERKFAPSERSPSKWLVEGGRWDVPATASSQLTAVPSDGLDGEQKQDRGAATGETTSVARSHPRFRVVDKLEASERLRGRAQQMQWRKILDEQVQEKRRLKQAEEEETRRREKVEAKKDVCCFRGQQKQQQWTPAVNAEAREDRSKLEPSYHALSSLHELVQAKRQLADARSSTYKKRSDSDERENDYVLLEPHRNQLGGGTGVAASHLPSQIPSQVQMPRGDEWSSGNNDQRDSFDRSVSARMDGRQPSFDGNNMQSSYQPVVQQRRIVDEYRSLLMEIRREREELRRDRDDVRREKDELRVQRALLQLENEKLVRLVDAQKVLNGQQQADHYTRLAQQARQQIQERQQSQERANQRRTLPVQDNNAHKVFELPSRHDHTFEMEAHSRLSHIRQGLVDLNVHDEHSRSAVRERRIQSPSPMSMADFVAPTPNKRMTNDFVYSPDFQPLSQYRPLSAATAKSDDDVMNRSLVGESVFVPLSPNSLNHIDNGPALQTASPSTSDVSSCRDNCLGSSRVIESRGFYDIHQEIKSNGEPGASVHVSASGSGITSDVGSRPDGGEKNAEDELGQLDDNSMGSHPVASSNLVQEQEV
ncbi:unnamed protein product [Hyaloperonospora brassicae]|uniref:CCDC66 domain-containing protein n=1 Tax=Hyaloperonospora brassicae TaxID=162125 RepID=A0AAV0SZW3_HYABA|nr:unnamed protein product [Hyaloperonospora brassicae]